jgi:hypothetical protein
MRDKNPFKGIWPWNVSSVQHFLRLWTWVDLRLETSLRPMTVGCLFYCIIIGFHCGYDKRGSFERAFTVGCVCFIEFTEDITVIWVCLNEYTEVITVGKFTIKTFSKAYHRSVWQLFSIPWGYPVGTTCNKNHLKDKNHLKGLSPWVVLALLHCLTILPMVKLRWKPSKNPSPRVVSARDVLL